MGKRVERFLPCELTEDEKATTSMDMAVHVREQAEIEDEAKSIAAEFRDKIKVKDTIIRRLAKMVETGEEERPVICQWDYHSPERGKKRLIRQDTFGVVLVDDMDAYDEEAYQAETQFKLPLEA